MPVQIRRSGTSIACTPEEEAALARTFEREHWIRLPALFDEDLVREAQARLAASDFLYKDAGGVAYEGTALDPVSGMWMLFANDPALFAFVERVTKCEKIGHFRGRMYRLTSSEENWDSWHDDLGHGRLVALSVNVGQRPYEGGNLQLRDRASERVLCEVENRGSGDAILFRLSSALQHQVTRVQGSEPKTAFAGWFTHGASFTELLASKAHGSR